MKKLTISVFAVFFLFAGLYAQKANRNTAVRCLKLAESSLIGQDWSAAYEQAELGLSYDDSISDLYYVKAASLAHSENSKTELIEIMNQAFEKNDWVDYSKNGARILLADLLCDTGSYEESLKILDDAPFIYSADSEFIRIKNYYRIATPASLEKARDKIETSRRVYSSDSRFPQIFFMFEFYYKMNAEFSDDDFKIPAKVQKIADSYIIKLPDYKGENTVTELLASFFAEENLASRLIKAIDSKNQTKNPLLALAGLQTGLYSQQKAYELFFELSQDNVNLFYLECLAKLITEPAVQEMLVERLTNFDGTVLIDENGDLQNEMTVKYFLGRPQTVNYDSNNDGERELYALCDNGAPYYILFDNSEIELNYDVYPQIKKVLFKNNNYAFNFLYDDFEYSPLQMTPDSVLNNYGLDFYIPESVHNPQIFDYQNLSKLCTTLEIPVTERENAKIVYTMQNGGAVFADFYEDEKHYAFADFAHGLPFKRFADYDEDGYFETVETFDVLSENYENQDSELSDPEYMTSIFSEAANGTDIVLKKIQIDRNQNTFFEYSEEYLAEENTKICYWDDNDDGITDCKYTRSGLSDNLREETIYYKNDGTELVCVTSLNSIPLKMRFENKEMIIFSGKNQNFYWINDEGTPKAEEEALKFAESGAIQGNVQVINADSSRVLIIKVGDNYFCRMLAPQDYYDIELENPETNE